MNRRVPPAIVAPLTPTIGPVRPLSGAAVDTAIRLGRPALHAQALRGQFDRSMDGTALRAPNEDHHSPPMPADISFTALYAGSRDSSVLMSMVPPSNSCTWRPEGAVVSPAAGKPYRPPEPPASLYSWRIRPCTGTLRYFSHQVMMPPSNC
jgi:hypothetical protein